MSRDRIPGAIRRHGIGRRVAVLLLSGLSLFAHVAVVPAQEPIVPSEADQPFVTHIAEASRRFRIPEHWIRAVLDAESGHDDRAVSPAGAIGLMQVMPATWADLRARHRLGDDPFDPRDNVLAGTAYLREMLDRYGNVSGMLAAYNAGPARYDEYLATGRPLPTETRDFVAMLAPLLGGKPLAGGPAAAPQPTDWREAPLFVVPAGDGYAAHSLRPDGNVEAEAATDPAEVGDATAPQSDGIFVARLEAGATQ